MRDALQSPDKKMQEKEVQDRLDVLFGEEPKFYNKPNPSFINEAGIEVWDSRSSAVVLTIMFWDSAGDEYYIPMGQRGTSSVVPDARGLWSLPCGYLDYNENGGEAAMRETREEIGLYVERLIYQQFLRGKRVYTSLYQPWHVNHFATANRQNVTLHFAVVLEWDMKEELPTLTNKYNEKEGEVIDFKYYPFYLRS